MAMAESLPVVDFSDPRHMSVLMDAVSADGPGFFYLKMPSLKVEELAKANLALSKQLFALPREEKTRVKNDETAWYWVEQRQEGAGTTVTLIPSTGAGYRGVAEDANFSGDMRESYNIGMPEALGVAPTATTSTLPHSPASSGQGEAPLPTATSSGMGGNLWPDAEKCPSADAEWLRNFQAQATDYFKVCLGTATQLRHKLASDVCLGPFLGDAAAADACFEGSTSLLGYTHYNYAEFKGAEDAPAGGQSFGIRPHQDDGLCTLLYTDGKPGLQYAKGILRGGVFLSDLSLYSGATRRDDAQLSPDIVWEPVPFREGHWIVNLGTDLFRWVQQQQQRRQVGGESGLSGRGCKATLHRVIPMEGAGGERYSMPFFYEPNLDVADRVAPFTRRWEYLVRNVEKGVVKKEEQAPKKPRVGAK